MTEGTGRQVREGECAGGRKGKACEEVKGKRERQKKPG
jgi:hypothetical protein